MDNGKVETKSTGDLIDYTVVQHIVEKANIESLKEKHYINIRASVHTEEGKIKLEKVLRQIQGILDANSIYYEIEEMLRKNE